MRVFNSEGGEAFWDEREFGAAAELMLGGNGQSVERGERFQRDSSAANGTDPGFFFIRVKGWIEVKMNCGAGGR